MFMEAQGYGINSNVLYQDNKRTHLDLFRILSTEVDSTSVCWTKLPYKWMMDRPVPLVTQVTNGAPLFNDSPMGTL
jgi:hypothetical protein